MAFINDNVQRRVAQAEQELKTVIEQERPAEAGAAIPKDHKEVLPAGDVPAIVDGVDWKERYGNLQRFIEKNLKVKHQQEIDALTAAQKALKKQVDDMVRSGSPANMPETAEAVEALKNENPKAYAAIMKVATDVAQKLVEDQMADMRSDVEQIKAARKQNAEEAAFVQLQKRFPDIDILGLEGDEVFMNWIRGKSKRFQDALFSNKEDVDAATDVLNLYKFEVLSKVQAPAKKQPQPGAEMVAPKSPANIPSGDTGWDFTESQIDEMDRVNPRWFEQNAEAIEKAMRTGRILKDISDPVGAQRRMMQAGMA
jgi:hypothetical protein